MVTLSICPGISAPGGLTLATCTVQSLTPAAPSRLVPLISILFPTAYPEPVGTAMGFTTEYTPSVRIIVNVALLPATGILATVSAG